MDFFARQEAARRSTRWLLVAFLFCVALVVCAVAGITFTIAGGNGVEREDGAAGMAVVAGIVTLAIILGASLFKSLSLRAGGGVVARSLGGTRIERGTRDLALKRLHNVVEEMAIASGVPMPEVYVLEGEDGINAFAAGNTPADAAVAVTRGAITRLNREELQGVIAHEFSHVLNGDMRLNSKLLGWVFGLLVVAIIARLVMQSGAYRGGRRDDKGGGGLMLFALAVMIIGYIGVFVGRILQAAVSRHRERLADASAVQFTRNPTGLVGALLKIAGVTTGSKLASAATDEVAHMLFAPGMDRLFSTHPAISERVRELDPAMARQNLGALAAAAARDAEALRLAPAFDDVGAPAVSSLQPGAPSIAPVEAATEPKRVSGLAGTFDETQQRYAHEAREAIPAELHAFADSPEAARVLLFALLRSADPAVAARQDAVLRDAYGEATTTRVGESMPVVNALAPALRLPAFQQLLPALRRMTLLERGELREVSEKLVLADQRIELFECCLGLLLEITLRDDIERRDEHGTRSLLQAADAVCNLFAILATQGADYEHEAQQAYDAGIEITLPQRARPYQAVERWPFVLRESLEELATLRPFAKKTLIEGLVRIVAHDRRLSVPESELLRTVCAALHCPLPPLLAAKAPE